MSWTDDRVDLLKKLWSEGLSASQIRPIGWRHSKCRYRQGAPPRTIRAQLLDGVWGRDAFVDERTVDVHIGRLRKSLIRGRETDLIRTVRGSGYIFGEH